MNKTDKKKDRPFVFVRCLTYNHEKYIEDALKGFAMQITDFPFLAVVIDDCSMDGTADIVRRYEAMHPDKIKGIYLPHNFTQTKEDKKPYYQEYVDKATYWAECEGDDYWTDPLKLQKQVDFLESHLEYDMVCARFNQLTHETGEIHNYDLYDGIMPDGAEGMELKQKHFVYAALPHPCTVMYRVGTMEDDDLLPKLKYRYDIPTYYCFMRHHRVWLKNQKMAIYRKHEGSLTDSEDTFRRKIYYAYADIYQYIPHDTTLQRLCAMFFRSCIAMPNARDKNYGLRDFIHDYKRYISYKPTIRKKMSFFYKIFCVRLKMISHRK